MVYHRRSPRLQGYDYAQAGAYFVTICTHQRAHLFGVVVDGEMSLNATEEFAAQSWLAIPDHFPSAELDAFIIMPNHMHGILLLTTPPTAANKPALGRIINLYKGVVTNAERTRRAEPEFRLWQSRYHDHIIRNEPDLNRIRDYVVNNPHRWEADTFFGAGGGGGAVGGD